MEKITSLKRVINLSGKLRKKGNTVGLVMGSFDILHMGHINLFRLAKKHCKILIVGLDNDKTIKLTKGKVRPINSLKRRLQFLAELASVDYIFPIGGVFKHGDERSFKYFEKIISQIKPDYLFTSIKCDGLWKEKKHLARKHGAKFIPDKSFVTHTSEILKKLSGEF